MHFLVITFSLSAVYAVSFVNSLKLLLYISFSQEDATEIEGVNNNVRNNQKVKVHKPRDREAGTGEDVSAVHGRAERHGISEGMEVQRPPSVHDRIFKNPEKS